MEPDVRDRLLQAWRGEIEAGAVYELIAQREGDPQRAEILRKMAAAEGGHRRRLEARMTELGIPIPDPSSVRLSWWTRLQARHESGSGCISPAIYGANDGLAAVFGIVSAVSGATGRSEFVLTAGVAGAVASALSMATGAFLAERSEVDRRGEHRPRAA